MTFRFGPDSGPKLSRLCVVVLALGSLWYLKSTSLPRLFFKITPDIFIIPIMQFGNRMATRECTDDEALLK